MKFRMKRCAAVLGAVAATALTGPATGAQAAVVEVSACDGAALSKPFQPWLDVADYKLAPRGDFEGSLSGWTLSGGAKKVSGSEPWGVTGKVGSSALAVPAGASALSAPTCVNAGAPTFRFFARSTGGLLPLMAVNVVYESALGGLLDLPVGVVTPTSSWQPSSIMLTGSALPAAVSDGDTPMQLRFTALSGSWQVDDVFVDPYARG